MDFEKKLIETELSLVKDLNFIPPKIKPDQFLKSTERSIKVRQEGNKLFSKRDQHNAKLHEEVWKLYCKAIASATPSSEELAAGYANRSALLLHLKKYEECLLDIERALKITVSDSMKVKLFCRKTECLVALQDGKQKISLAKAKYWLNKIEDEQKGKKALIEMVEKAEKILEKNIADCKKKEKVSDIQVKQNAVCISYNQDWGRCLTASRDISVGEFVCMEKSYVTSVNSKKLYAYCSHCLAISWTMVPCDHCSYYMFCGEKCKEEAWKLYHDIECFIRCGVDDLTDYYTQMSVRALVMGIREAGSIDKLRDMMREIDNCTDKKTKGFTKDGKFLSNSFRSVYSLNPARAALNMHCYSRNALYAFAMMAKNTDILGKDFNYDSQNLKANEDAFFIATLLVRLHLIFTLNSFNTIDPSIDCRKKFNPVQCAFNRCCPRGVSFSPLVSLFNHSCDSNVNKFYTNDGNVVYYALKPIAKNSQIFSSYYCTYERIEKSERQKVLKELFEFDCNCVACKNNIPEPGSDLAFEEDKKADPRDFKIGYAMMMKYEAIVQKPKNHPRRFNEKTIRDFAKDLDKMLKTVKKTMFLFHAFNMTLLMMMEGTYGTRLHIPKECKM